MKNVEETLINDIEFETNADPLENIVNMYYSESKDGETKKFIELLRLYVSVYGSDIQPLEAAINQINSGYYAIILNRIIAGLSDEKIVALCEAEMNLLELMFTENVNVNELVAALQQYVSVNGTNLQPIAVNVAEFSRYSAETNCDYTFGWIDKETNVNPKSTTTLTAHPIMENCYILTSAIQGRPFSREIDLPEQIFAELRRYAALDGSNIELGKPFDSKIIVQLYNDYREAIIDAYTFATVNAIVGGYAIPVNMIVTGVSDEEIIAYFKTAMAENKAKQDAEWEEMMINCDELENAEYEKFSAAATPTLRF